MLHIYIMLYCCCIMSAGDSNVHMDWLRNAMAIQVFTMDVNAGVDNRFAMYFADAALLPALINGTH